MSADASSLERLAEIQQRYEKHQRNIAAGYYTAAGDLADVGYLLEFAAEAIKAREAAERALVEAEADNSKHFQKRIEAELRADRAEAEAARLRAALQRISEVGAAVLARKIASEALVSSPPAQEQP